MGKLKKWMAAIVVATFSFTSLVMGTTNALADEGKDDPSGEVFGIKGDPGYVGEPAELSPQDKALLAQLDQQTLEEFGIDETESEARLAGTPADIAANSPIVPGGGPWAMTVYGAHPFPQEQTWTCGPATYRMIANVYGYPTSERNAIRFVGATPSSGTSLSMIQKALNDIPGVASYRMRSLPSYNGGRIPREHISTFKNRAIVDLNRGRPLAVNVSIPAGASYFPPNYPKRGSMRHHMAVMGYRNGGAQMHVYDPMGNSPAFVGTQYQWIQPMYDYEITKLVRAMGDRGYLW
ncbi:hypothetical protein ACU19_00305 [Actinobaculum suis]|uniref:C39 family peptidase n=1 Tax=Actinobaculum suis TaxID=1657 RepID=UPI00066FE85C|nr:C39 family peptidase [Actinobaculum suis]KMY24163.1 hypothetical protein ACU19_00305 [Actinobaculum suis]